MRADSKDHTQEACPRVVTNIDRRTCRRIVPMRVLVLGLSRTGTNSLREALEQIGYNSTYHGYAAVLENPRDCEMWLHAMRAKFEGKGKPFGKIEFDQLLGHCQAVTDIPAACFAPELIAAYPDAKVILTNRDIDVWYDSVMRNLISEVYNPWAATVAALARLVGSNGRWSRPVFTVAFDRFYRHFPTNGKVVYQEHYAAVRALVPSERLLEYRITEGWGPLCEFLGHQKPATPFPRGNDSEMTQKLIQQLIMSEALQACQKLLILLACFALVFLLVC